MYSYSLTLNYVTLFKYTGIDSISTNKPTSFNRALGATTVVR